MVNIKYQIIQIENGYINIIKVIFIIKNEFDAKECHILFDWSIETL